MPCPDIPLRDLQDHKSKYHPIMQSFDAAPKLQCAADAGLSATSAGTCASRWDIADRLRDLGLHGVTTAPRHRVTQDDLLPALEGEEAAAALWQHLGDKVGETGNSGVPPLSSFSGV